MKRPRTAPVDVSAELASLKHNEAQNKLPKLPPNTTVERRPINHAAIASPFAGAKTSKVVYISRKTPVMSAVKRVKKFLREIEKRAMQSSGVDGVLDKAGGRRGQGSENLHAKLEDVSDKLRRDAEEVLVKASGRAMEQALRIGEWFRTREEELMTKVEVRTGSVSVIDDLVEQEEVIEEDDKNSNKEMEAEDTALEGGDTTMELLKNLEKNVHDGVYQPSEQQDNSGPGQTEEQAIEDGQAAKAAKSKNSRRKRRRKEYDPDDIPEARIRWVKTVEVAISFRA